MHQMSETISQGRLGGVINAQWAWHEIQLPANRLLKYAPANRLGVTLIRALPMTDQTLDFKAIDEVGNEIVIRLEWHQLVEIEWKGRRNE